MTRSGMACGQRAHHHVGDALAGLQAAVDRGGVRAVQDAALGRGDAERPRQAGIGRNAGIEHRLHDVVDGREQRGVGHVDAGAHLVRRVEGERHGIALHRHLDGERQELRHLLVVEHVLEAPGAVGHGGDGGAHLALGVVHQRLAGAQHRRACRTSRRAPGSAARRRGWPPSARAGRTGARAAPGSSAGSGPARRPAARRRGRAAPAGCAGPPGRYGHGRGRRSRHGGRGSPSRRPSFRRRRPARPARCRAGACRRPRRHRCR